MASELMLRLVLPSSDVQLWANARLSQPRFGVAASLAENDFASKNCLDCRCFKTHATARTTANAF